LYYILAANLLTKNTQNTTIARNRIRKLEDMLVNAPEKLETIDLISCERDIGRLGDIVEDQYLGFGVISSLSNLKKDSQLTELLAGFEPLNKSLQRMEDKTESLRLQYLLYQQDNSNRKINVLTIVQAIFVPLTFLAGIYGMNFVNIPELNNPNGYFILWGVFGLITIILIAYFYKNGWFD